MKTALYILVTVVWFIGWCAVCKYTTPWQDQYYAMAMMISVMVLLGGYGLVDTIIPPPAKRGATYR